jgi:hypothetical protein
MAENGKGRGGSIVILVTNNPNTTLSALPLAPAGDTEPEGLELWVPKSNRFPLMCPLLCTGAARIVTTTITGSVGLNAVYQPLHFDIRG